MNKSCGYNVKVKINKPSRIIKDHGLDEDGKATEFLRDTVYRLYEPYVPRNQGNLYRQTTFPSAHEIKHIVPYGHAMYKGNKFKGASKPKGIKRKTSNESFKFTGAPKRGKEWDKRMMNDRGQEVCEEVEEFVRNGNC